MSSQHKILKTEYTPYFNDSGYMTPEFNINQHLEDNKNAVEKLQHLTNILSKLDLDQIKLEEDKLLSEISNTEGFTKKIIQHATNLHEDYVSTISSLAMNGKITKKGLIKYFIQGWYHTRYTPKFEHMFTELMETQVQDKQINISEIDHKTNKFVKLMVDNIDEEEGHELWALQDILFLGEKDSIDVMNDVFPETKAIVWSQHDRLTRLPFIGFLGYSFYLELMIARHSLKLLNLLNNSLSTNPKDHKFIYYHYVVDQGHAVDNIQLLNRITRTEEDYKEVIDNMSFIHAMYKGLTLRSFA
jgi:pyrroloquinoline quinone (PQQ) biosynthesis protein C